MYLNCITIRNYNGNFFKQCKSLQNYLFTSGAFYIIIKRKGIAMETSVQNIWENLHANARFQPKYPHEIVVRWVMTNFKSNRSARILDLGCGAGRHTMFMANEGFNVVSADISKNGVAETALRAQQSGHDIETAVTPLHQINFAPESFDGIMSYGVFNYASMDEIHQAVQKIHSILKPGGKALVVTRGDRDWRTQYADLVDHSTYYMSRLEGGTPSDCEQGMTQVYMSKEDIASCFIEYSKIEIDEATLSWQGGKYMDHDWIISGQK
jgi:2-polyprenyl-3-methyl-5-hydroxy-6-metoxy-1,4-benzoquinol methylase